MVENVKPALAEQMAVKHPKKIDDRKVPKELGGRAEVEPHDRRPVRRGDGLGSERDKQG